MSMQSYAVCEISGKQYRVSPNKPFAVSLQKAGDTLEAQVLLLSENGKLSVGKPYLKENLTLKKLGDEKGEKIRVAKFHAKANYRRVIGYRSRITKVVWDVALGGKAVKKTA